MEGVAPVKLAIRHGREHTWRDAATWPLPETDWRELYLGAGTLLWDRPLAGAVRYPASFDLAPVDEPLELTGPVTLRLWISADVDDADVMVRLQHIDVGGEPIPAVGPQGQPMPMAIGWLRASHRELDPERSEPYRPWHPHRSSQPLKPGEPTLLEIEIWPTSITLAPGERLRLELVCDDDDLAPLVHNHPADRRPADAITIHFGAAHASHLLVPVIPD